MKRLFRWFFSLSNRIRDSFYVLMTLIGLLSTLFTILGVSLSDCINNVWGRLGVVVAIFVLSYVVIYGLIGEIFKDSVQLSINGTNIIISYGDIFAVEGWKIIGCDTHFDTRVNDVVISKNSLHGKMMLEHGNISDILGVVEKEAIRLSLTKNENGLYDFPLGTIIRYIRKTDDKDENYLLLAMTKLDDQFKACTNMAEFENMLMRMWTEIDRVYAGHPIVIPLLGTGISRFKDKSKNTEMLLRCLLCTLNVSGVRLNTTVKIVIYDETKRLPFYEYRYMFNV